MADFIVKPLDKTTWPDFARLVEHAHFRPDLKPYVEKLLSKAAA